jgi:hypothetical protein
MRRIILLGAVMPIAALGILAVTQTVLLAQSPKSESPKASTTAAPGSTNSSPFAADASADAPVAPEGRTVAASAPALDASPIRQRFMELSKKKAYALTEEQLKREVESMEAEVRELEAWVKAQEAVRVLHEVVEKHPNTKAAGAASAAIQLIEHRRNTPALVPDPGPGSFDSQPFDRPDARRPVDKSHSAPSDPGPPASRPVS